jgi:ABC-type transport system substrate-binding protein
LNLTYHSSQGRYAKDKEFAEAIALQLAKIGVNVTVKFHEWITFTKLWSTHKAYDMHVMSRQDRELEGAIMYPLLACNQTAVTFCDPELDKKILDASATWIQLGEPMHSKSCKKRFMIWPHGYFYGNSMNCKGEQ